MAPLYLSENSTFEQIPPGTHFGVCTGIFDLGTSHDGLYNKDVRRVLIVWEIPDHEGKTLAAFYSFSLNNGSKLREHLDSWRGPLSPEEAKKLDLFSMLDEPAALTVIHKPNREGELRARVESVGPLPDGIEPPRRRGPLLSFSFMDDDPEVPEETPDWIVNLIQKSDEWEALTRPPDEEVGDEGDEADPF